jgi:teichoic acid ribitol-phosphate primase
VRAFRVRAAAILVRTGFAIGRLRPPRERVVLATAHGAAIGGNLRCIRDELARRRPPVEVVVLASRTGTGLAGSAREAWRAVVAGYHLASARVFVVDDYYVPMYVITPRRGTLRVQTWHAAGAFKKIGYSVLDKTFGADATLVERVAIHSNYDVCLMPSEEATRHYMEAFRLPRERFTTTTGLPRTDVLADPAQRERAAAAVRARYAIPDGRKVLLYAPTFRGDSMHVARYDDDLDLRAMHAALGSDWVLLLRLHPFVVRSLDVPAALADFVRDVSDWPEMNEVMTVADLLVTDYSSAIFEFALLGRPMAFFAPDLDAYEGERGFYVDYRSWVPGPILQASTDLAAYVAAGEFDVERSRRFAAAAFAIADGHATERVVERVILPALRGEAPSLGGD